MVRVDGAEFFVVILALGALMFWRVNVRCWILGKRLLAKIQHLASEFDCCPAASGEGHIRMNTVHMYRFDVKQLMSEFGHDLVGLSQIDPCGFVPSGESG